MTTAAINADAVFQTHDDVTIAGSAATCIEIFNAFLADGVILVERDNAESSVWVEEQMARFNIWASNLGVFAGGHASADYRLRDADEFRTLIIQLLNALRENLLCTVTGSIIQRENETSNNNSGSNTSERQSPTSSTSSFTFSSMSSSRATIEDAIPTSVLEARSEVEDAISRLNRLSASIRKSGAQFRDAKAAAFVHIDDEGNNRTDFYARLSILVIKQKFPDACEKLQKRLADSLARRRNQLAYRRRHQQKLAPHPASEPALPSTLYLDPSHQAQIKPVEAATLLPQQAENPPIQFDAKQKLVSNTSASFFDPKRFINRPESTMSTAPSTAILGTPSQVATLNFPSEPKLDRSGFFECPYCFIISPAKEARGKYWKHHVMKDLAPYICLFDDCKSPGEGFQTFSDWIVHIQNEHASLHWDCLAPIHEPKSFEDQDLYIEHMICYHAGAFANSQLPALAQMSARAESRLFTICPLCNHLPEDLAERIPGLEVKENQLALQKHIAQHLQSLSLVSLAWLDDSNSHATSERGRDLFIQDDSASLDFDDPPKDEAQFNFYLDPDWKGISPTAKNIEDDQAWGSGRTSDEAALEWWFMIDPLAGFNPDHTQDETLAPFVAASSKPTVVEPTSQSITTNLLYPEHREDFLELCRVHCNRLEHPTVSLDLLPWQDYGDDSSYHLRGDQIYTGPIAGIFIVYHDYICPCIPNKGSPFSLNIPAPKDTIKIISRELCNASKSLVGNSRRFLPFYVGEEITSPYLIVYSNRAYIDSRFKLLDSTARRVLEGFLNYIHSSLGSDYEEADRHFTAGLTNFKSIPFLFSTTRVLITTRANDVLAFQHKPTLHAASDLENLTWMVYAEELTFNKRNPDDFSHKEWKVDVQTRECSITVKLPSNEELVQIQDLTTYPLKFASAETVRHLQERGNKWKDLWTSDSHRYVSYASTRELENNTHLRERFIIDMQIYWKTHTQIESHLSEGLISKFSLDENLLLLPHEIFGLSLSSMSWSNLRVDDIKEIVWRANCFDDLVIDKSIRSEILTLINAKRFDKDKPLPRKGKGKGSRLVILFHGSPGIGKSTTSECIAEYLQKPLYRESVQDLVSDPEKFEEKLAETFALAERWDCVVILEEAGDLLQAPANDESLKKNVVSRFLRVIKKPLGVNLLRTFLNMIENFDGILIITTSTTGPFDPEWKSRGYPTVEFSDFVISQRKKIWQILIDQTNSDQRNINISEDDVGRLAAFQLNATEIQEILRNGNTFGLLLRRCIEIERLRDGASSQRPPKVQRPATSQRRTTSQRPATSQIPITTQIATIRRRPATTQIPTRDRAGSSHSPGRLDSNLQGRFLSAENFEDKIIIRTFKALNTFIEQHTANFFPHSSPITEGEFANPLTRHAKIRQYLARKLIARVVENDGESSVLVTEIFDHLAPYCNTNDDQRGKHLSDIYRLSSRLREAIENHVSIWTFDFSSPDRYFAMAPALLRDGEEEVAGQMFEVS